jgi:hypothetical protein
MSVFLRRRMPFGIVMSPETKEYCSDAKRKEFKALRNKAFRDLREKHGETCQLGIHADCSKDKRWEVDHIIPLATNELNKKLRNMARSPALSGVKRTSR